MTRTILRIAIMMGVIVVVTMWIQVIVPNVSAWILIFRLQLFNPPHKLQIHSLLLLDVVLQIGKVMHSENGIEKTSVVKICNLV